MTDTWQCGDCKAVYPMTRTRCGRPFDDELGMKKVKTVDEYMEKVIAPYLRRFDDQAFYTRHINKPWHIIAA